MTLSHAQDAVPRIVITPGEPAGIGPDVVLMAAQKSWGAELVCIADRDLLAQRAKQLSLNIDAATLYYRRRPSSASTRTASLYPRSSTGANHPGRTAS